MKMTKHDRHLARVAVACGLVKAAMARFMVNNQYESLTDELVSKCHDIALNSIMPFVLSNDVEDVDVELKPPMTFNFKLVEPKEWQQVKVRREVKII